MTKDRILEVSIDLFSQFGYDGVQGKLNIQPLSK